MAIFFLSQTTIEGKHFLRLRSMSTECHFKFINKNSVLFSIFLFYSVSSSGLRRKLLKCVNAAQCWCAAPVLRRKFFLIMFPATKLDSNDRKASDLSMNQTWEAHSRSNVRVLELLMYSQVKLDWTSEARNSMMRRTYQHFLADQYTSYTCYTCKLVFWNSLVPS